MKLQQGFTLIELIIAIAVVGVLSTFAVMGFAQAVQAANFLDLKDAASRVALAQQNHRQIFNQFASRVQASGSSSADTLLFADASKYDFSVDLRSYNEFVVDVQTRPGNSMPSDDCFIVRVRNRQGILVFESFDKEAKNNTTSNCLQNG